MNLKTFLPLLFLTLLVIPAMSQSYPEGSVAWRMDSLLTATYPADEPGATVLVRKGDEVLLRKAYGMADMELQVPMKPEYVFRIGSITKQFTAAAILMLREEGKLNLDDPITRHLKDYPSETGDKVTILHLLHHTSGIPSYTNQNDFASYVREDLRLEELVAKFSDKELEFEPGTQWSYNNSGYVLLGAIIEAASGRSYEDYIENEIFRPLGMNDSHYGNLQDIIPGRVEGYTRNEEEIIISGYLSMSLPHAAGSLLSSVDDLARWDKALYGEELLPAAVWQEAWTPASLTDGTNTGYGYGWLLGEVGGRKIIEHGGGINGFRSIITRMPGEDLLVVVLQNREWKSPPPLAARLADMVLGESSEPALVKLKPKKRAEYAGNYKVGDGDFRIVTLRNDTLFSKRNRNRDFALLPVGKDVFYSPEDNYGRFIFVRNKKGDITELVFRPRSGMYSRSYRTDEEPPAAPEEIKVDASQLQKYAGTYELSPAFSLRVYVDQENLMVQGTGQPAIPVYAADDNTFFAKAVDAEIEFVEEDGQVKSLVLHQGGQSIPGTRVD